MEVFGNVNELELLQVIDYLQSRGISSANIRNGNECVWVTTGSVNRYFLFAGGKIVDVVVD